MSQLKSYTIFGIIFVIISGSLFHFLYQWSNNNFIVGLFTPVNESIWEHMKLLFFPMLLYFLIAAPKLKDSYPCITSAIASGLLIGTLLIPVIFYTYTGILGYSLFILDILAFVLSVMAAFYFVYSLASTCRMQNHAYLLYLAVYLLAIAFLVFTYCPLNLRLFADPAMTSKS